MKKIYLMIGLFIILVFAGCENDIEDEVIINNDLTTANFESFFYITTRLIAGEEPTLFFEVTPKKEYSEIDGNVTIALFYEYFKDNEIVNEVFVEDVNLSNEIVRKETKLIIGQVHNILDVAVLNASGSIKTLADHVINLKTYDFPVEISKGSLVEDLKENILVYQALEKEMETFDSKERDSYIVKSRMSQVFEFPFFGNTVVTQTTLKARKDPFYYEVLSNDASFIADTYNDDYFLYQWTNEEVHGKKKVSSQMLSKSELDDLKLEAFEDDNTINPFASKFAKMKFEKIGNKYIVHAYIKDVLEDDMYNQLISIYEMLDISPLTLEEATLQLDITFNETGFLIETSFTLDFKDHDAKVISNHVEEYIFETFYIKDIRHDEGFYFPYPSTLNEVHEQTNVLEFVHQKDPGQTHVYLTYLDKGVYKFIQSGQSLTFKIFDQVGSSMALNKAPDIVDSELFEIKKSGLYYIEINKDYNYGYNYSFKFEKTALNDFIDNVVYLDLKKPVDFEIESNIDVVKFSLNTKDKAVYKLIFNQSEEVVLYHPYAYGITQTRLNDEFVYGAAIGVHDFYLRADQAISGSITLEKTEIKDIFSFSLNNMEKVPKQWFDKDFYFGGTLGSGYLKHEVKNAGFYTFYTRNIQGYIYESKDDGWYSVDTISNGNTIYLEAKTYIIILDSTEITPANIYVEMEFIESKTEEITLNRANYNDYLYNDLDEYQVTLYNKSHEHTYVFTLENDEMICIRNNNLILKNEDDEILNLYADLPNYNSNYEIYDLVAGTYSITFKGIDDMKLEHNFGIIIVDLVPVDDSLMINSYVMTNQGIVVLRKDHAFDNEVIKIVIEEDGAYVLQGNVNFYLFLDKGQLHGGAYRNTVIHLNQGTYYVYVDFYTWRESLIAFSLIKTD